MSSLAVEIREGRHERAVVRRRLKAIFIGSMGNLVEWYDF